MMSAKSLLEENVCDIYSIPIMNNSDITAEIIPDIMATFIEISKKHGWVLERHEIEPMGFYIKLKRFLFNRYDYYFRIYRKIVKINRKFVLKIVHVFIFSILSLCYLPQIFQLMYKQLGISQWIVFKKKS